MHQRTLWEDREVFAEAFAEIFVSSTSKHEGLRDWMVANVASLFMKGCKKVWEL